MLAATFKALRQLKLMMKHQRALAAAAMDPSGAGGAQDAETVLIRALVKFMIEHGPALPKTQTIADEKVRA
jgi:hypothetical protein